MDILVNFMATHMNSDGDWEISNKKIAKHYLKGNFTIDFITSIPFDWIIGWTSKNNYP